MVIKFIVTGAGWKPLGGLKMIYEYANRLDLEGHTVEIIYVNRSPISGKSKKNIIKLFIKYWYFRLNHNKYKCSKWFNLSSSVNETWRNKLILSDLEASDRIIATTVQSAYALNEIHNNGKGIRCYFIQGYENWGESVTNEMVDKSYFFFARNIAVSSWLTNYINTIGASAHFVPNGFDVSKFYTLIDPTKRFPESVAVMYSPKYSKGFQDSLKAILKVKRYFSSLKVTVFGLDSRPEVLPQWITYTRNPSQEELTKIYNENAIFLASSHAEGWGLTIGEAMLCSCAVVCTDNKGYLEMATNNITALVSPIQDPNALADNVMRLLYDSNLRQSLAIKGHDFISGLNINRTFQIFKNVLLSD